MNTTDILKHAARISNEQWDKTADRAAELMAGHAFGCSEAVLLSFQELLGKDILPEILVSASSAFRGGMGGAGCSCGSLAGGEIVLGAVFGYKGDAEGRQNPDIVAHMRSLYKDLHDRFQNTAGSACCRDLIKGLEPKSNQRSDTCQGLVRLAVKIAGSIIDSEAAKYKQ